MTSVDIEITPEPSPEERAAIEAALDELLLSAEGVPPPGAWWRAGIAEATDDGEPETL